MKRLFLVMSVVAASLLAASASIASTHVVTGVNLAWSNCFGEGTPVQNKAFACNINTGTNLMVASFLPPVDVPTVNGNEVVIDILASNATTTALASGWWSFKNAGACRQSSLTVNFTANAANAVCLDEFAGAAAGGIGAYTQTAPSGGWSVDNSLTAAHYRLTVAIAVPASAIAPVLAGSEYFALNIGVNNLKSIGTGSCTGCADPVCIVLNSIKLTQPVGVGDFVIGNAASAGSNVVTWQGGVSGGCAAVPAKNTTWGAIKSLYR